MWEKFKSSTQKVRSINLIKITQFIDENNNKCSCNLNQRDELVFGEIQRLILASTIFYLTPHHNI